MSNFSVPVVRLSVDPVDHPGADRLSLLNIIGWTCVTAKKPDGAHSYNAGDLVVYVPEGSLVPEYLLRRGFWDQSKNRGILAGPEGNRVKAVRLRGVLSQGIVFPVRPNGDFVGPDGKVLHLDEGHDAAAALGITKYEPPVPVHMAGLAKGLHGKTLKYDFESIQWYGDMFKEGEPVAITEKIHGTHCQIGFRPRISDPDLFGAGGVYVTSKGLGARGLVLVNNEENGNNVYVRALRELVHSGIEERVKGIWGESDVTLFGEIHGKGIQDLTYGENSPKLRIFDICVDGKFLKQEEFSNYAQRLGIPTVPLLYLGSFSREAAEALRDGVTVAGVSSNPHIREGIVIKCAEEKNHPVHGRRICKWVSPSYLTRKGDITEFN